MFISKMRIPLAVANAVDIFSREASSEEKRDGVFPVNAVKRLKDQKSDKDSKTHVSSFRGAVCSMTHEGAYINLNLPHGHASLDCTISEDVRIIQKMDFNPYDASFEATIRMDAKGGHNVDVPDHWIHRKGVLETTPHAVNQFIGKYVCGVPQYTIINNKSAAIESRGRVLLIGHEKHGLTTVANILERRYDLGIISDVKHRYLDCILGEIEQKGYTVENVLECRGKYSTDREHWKEHHGKLADFMDISNALNKKPANEISDLVSGVTHAENIFDGSHIVYDGMHKREWFDYCKAAGFFKHIIWVNSYKDVPLVAANHAGLTAKDATTIIDNTGTLEDLKRQLHLWHHSVYMK